MEFNYIFPKDFKWGVSTAAYQIEGAVNEDGRGESIWDRFTAMPGNIMDGSDGRIASDHYHRWKEDVQLIKTMGVKVYRFSIAWARIYPEGIGEVNKKGLQFYSDLVDELLANGIEPAVTLYHWDLPQALQNMGGWANRDCADWFLSYAKTVFECLGDRVKLWMTLNEPWVVCFEGYYYGHFAPGFKDFSTALLAAHNILRGHGKVVKLFRELRMSGEIGITLNLCPKEPAGKDYYDIDAAKRNDGFSNRWFLDAVFKGKYPDDMKVFYRSKGIILPNDTQEDMDLISVHFDFLGVNYYNIDFTKEDKNVYPLEFSLINMEDRYRVTNYGWPITEYGLTDLLVRIDREYGHPKIIVTENGASFLDVQNIKNEVLDDNRIDYLERHIIACHKAIDEGVNLAGYFVWTLVDDFEWNTGFHNCFGLVYMDRRTRNRTIKKSGMWYKMVIEKNGIY